MKKFIVIFLTLLLFFSVSPHVFAQDTCSSADIPGFNFEGQPAKLGDPLTVAIQTSPALFNKNVTVKVTNAATGAVFVETSIPINGSGLARFSVVLPAEGRYTIDVSVGGKTCFESNYSFSPSAGTDFPKPPNSGSSITGSCGEAYIDTAIGCVPYGDKNALIGFILRWGLGIGGGIAFLLLLVAGFQITTSRGDPNKLKAGQELMTSAIAGLLLLIFSLVILRIIGFDILNISSFK